ncbi:MAG: DEAD/DEAH box helicase, partial [Chloroflexota bacterium]|nr:DEAD/DEAH box helicase [Chloroflexota bacterium]
MSSSPSSSELPVNPGVTSAYERLHPRVRAWIWDQGWDELRATQVKAIGPIMDGDTDVIISAATASGKTEAAWLPVCSVLGFDAEAGHSLPGIKAMYLSPLKALINDQYGRLSDLGSYVDVPVYRRHGDVGGADRKAVLSRPDGILLITPESLEALFVHHGTRMPTVLNGLRAIVIDEMHAFIGSERGAQLQSLLHRVELAIRRRVPRIALSATLADHDAAASFLRPGDGASVTVVGDPSDDRSELRMQLRGYLVAEPPSTPVEDEEDDDHVTDEEDASDTRTIARHLFTTLRGTDNLVFANARRTVETYADLLTQVSADERVPNEFFPHHGNLSKEFREDVERRLKSNETHATAICTSTLELGIDIGSADSIAQIGAPGSVTALRQRLGRSGRRGQPATLRLYVSEDALDERTSPVDQLRTETIQTIATVELLLERWYEPPNTGGLHLSTLIQQVLSVIAQHGGASAPQLFSALCADGPFAHVTQPMFVQLLRDLGTHDLITQASDGMLLPGGAGERLINHYTFYTAFQTAEDY